MKKISIIFGTRPEAIKLAPLILELRKHTDQTDCRVCVTGQHCQMLDQVLDSFKIRPDFNLAVMEPGQTLGTLTARAIVRLDEYFQRERPDCCVVQGDTTSVLSAALTAFYHQIPVAHVEAGLRTGDMYSPWPEEANRVLTSRLAWWHFCPTERNRQNLLKEGIPSNRIFVTGNTGIDALFLMLRKMENQQIQIPGLPGNSLDFLGNRRMVLITSHRRENFGKGFERICQSIIELAERFPEIAFIYPVHLNPNVKGPVERILGGAGKQNVYLISPQQYIPFIALMNHATLILTDSGGVQEEAPSLGKPVLVMRDTTERPEAVEAGNVKLVGTDQQAIANAASVLLRDAKEYAKMGSVINPYGDGHAAERIAGILLKDD